MQESTRKEVDRVEFVTRLERDCQKITAVTNKIFSSCNDLLRKKDHMQLVKLVEYSSDPFFLMTADTRYLFFNLQALSEEMIHESPTFFIDRFEDSKSLIQEYRRIILLIRRMELFPEADDMFSEAVECLLKENLSPYLYKTILQSELFEQPKELSIAIYNHIVSTCAEVARLRYLICFSEVYPDNFWHFNEAEVFLSMNDAVSALNCLLKIASPDSDTLSLIHELEGIVNE